jgi:hypothetical protein
VLPHAKAVELVLLLVIVSAYPLEAAGAITESVGENAHFGLAKRDDFSFKVTKEWQCIAH